MQIELTEIGKPTKQGQYVKMKVAYLRDGKKVERNLVSIGKTKEVMQGLTKRKPGDVVDISVEKSDDGNYWNWVGIADAAAGDVSSTKRNSVQRSTYETPEERAKRQVYIVRQSSISSAIEYLTAQGKKYSEQDVLNIARTFVSFVFSTEGQQTVDEAAVEIAAEEVENTKDLLEDDIPF